MRVVRRSRSTVEVSVCGVVIADEDASAARGRPDDPVVRNEFAISGA
jgi:hypothetical protein